MVSPDNEHAPEQLIEDTPHDAPPPPPRKRGGLRRALLGLLMLAALTVAGGYAAVLFQDQDPRLKMVAEMVEEGVVKAREIVSSVAGDQAPGARGKITTRRTAAIEETPKEGSASEPEEAASPPQIDPEAVRKAQRDADEAVRQAKAQALEKAQTEAAAAEERARAEAEAAEEKARAEADAERRAAEEKLAREAVERAEREKAAAKPAAAIPNPEELTARDLVGGLEGRVDELGDEIKAIRERLDAPKNETRAAPEAVEKPAPSPDSGAAQIVVAYTLQRQLEAGKPIAEELAALTRLGADSAALDSLRPLAEGAPTAAQLHAQFAALAKKIRVPDTGHAEDLTEQLSKLVKVRPPGQAAPADNSVDGIIARIDAALTHNDLVAAETALANLPENARIETRSFAERLHARAEADKAAEALVHGAIMALGKN